MKKTVLQGVGMTPEEYEEMTRKMHPDWFDEDGNRLPTQVSGHKGPGGVHIPYPDSPKYARTPEKVGANIGKKWVPTMQRPIPAVRCVKIKKDGKRCGRWSVRGIEFCIVHGGRRPGMKKKAEDVVNAARMQLFDLSEDAAKVLGDLLKEGTSDAIRLKAAQDVLDRAGLKSAIDVNVEVEHKVSAAAVVSQRLDKLTAKVVEDQQSSEDRDVDFYSGLLDGSFDDDDSEDGDDVVDAELED